MEAKSVSRITHLVDSNRVRLIIIRSVSDKCSSWRANSGEAAEKLEQNALWTGGEANGERWKRWSRLSRLHLWNKCLPLSSDVTHASITHGDAWLLWPQRSTALIEDSQRLRCRCVRAADELSCGFRSNANWQLVNSHINKATWAQTLVLERLDLQSKDEKSH